ncbi:MAG: hypothetical protein BRC25_02185 [Parcubacteria group bacterium SW_6_46_9]|nr:MAG: hypothetical protein BRC25_02185 [Parcubacteria group bacterium SW_6_46_9]
MTATSVIDQQKFLVTALASFFLPAFFVAAAPLPSTNNIVVNEKAGLCTVDDELPGDECKSWPLKPNWEIRKDRRSQAGRREAKQYCKRQGYEFVRDVDVRQQTGVKARNAPDYCTNRAGEDSRLTQPKEAVSTLLDKLTSWLQAMLLTVEQQKQ